MREPLRGRPARSGSRYNVEGCDGSWLWRCNSVPRASDSRNVGLSGIA